MSATRILIIDDFFGRVVQEAPNTDRENLCAHFLWRDATGDVSANASRQKVLEPTAEAVFCRAQSPACSSPGGTVENDLGMAMDAVRKGWKGIQDSRFVISDSGRDSNSGRKRRKSAISNQQSKISNQQSVIPWSMVLIDLCFYTGRVTVESHRRTPGMPEGRPGDDDPRSYFGLTLLDAIHREFPEIPIFILSSKPREEVSLEFSRRGALGFIDRSALDGPELLQQALWNHGLLADSLGEIVGHSLPILLALREARRAAGHRENVLIRGERGSGKELIARYVHRANSKFLNPESRFDSENSNQESGIQNQELPRIKNQDSKIKNLPPLVVVNSAIFTPNLFASELFGIEPKTATAVDGKIGLIEMAKGGDLFLDEIADMPPEVQAAMLRVLQERKLTRVGGRKSLDVDVRFLAATNADLDDPERGFRPDLLDRLRLGGTIWVPPLRDRPDDIPLLVEKFVREAEAMRPGTHRRTVSPEAFEVLSTHDWPGNIRELRSVIFDAVSRHPDVEHLVAGHLRVARKKDEGMKAAPAASVSLNGNGIGGLVEVVNHCKFPADEIGKWAGQLDRLQQSHSAMVARYLHAALEATKRRTPEQPEGAIQIHPAAKLATGNPKLTATEAADLFKRLLGPICDELEGDLLAAYRTSLRLRPRSPTRRSVSPPLRITSR
jgi:DNA-binding NtrC family response regulator